MADAPTDAGERIAKRIARAGVCSRRDAERLIAEGRVTLDGKTVTEPGTRVLPSSLVVVDGKPLPAPDRARLWRYHKPAGLICTNRDPEGRASIFDRLPRDLPRVVSVGRLDVNSEGLLLLTNDGGLARALELPANAWMRRYRVRAFGSLTDDAVRSLARGIAVDGVSYGPVEAAVDRVQGGNTWISIGIKEGKNREVRKLLEHFGLKVNRLIRTAFGPFQLGHLDRGEVDEVPYKVIADQLGHLLPKASAHADRRR